MSGMTSPTNKSIKDRVIRPKEARILGRGTYGTVYEGMDVSTGRLVAIKEIILERTASASAFQRIMSEISVMRKCQHKNIVSYLGAARDDNVLQLFMELIPGGSITRLLTLYGRLPEDTVGMFAGDIVDGLAYLHSENIAHRDIKCENVLVDHTGIVKLGDFGCAKAMEAGSEHGTGTLAGTPYYMAPEIIRGKYDPFLADAWAVGCAVVEMLTGEPPFKAQYPNTSALMLALAKDELVPVLPTNISEACRDFLEQTLERDPKQRTPIAELVDHPFLIRRPSECPVTPQARSIAAPANRNNSPPRSPSPGAAGAIRLGGITPPRLRRSSTTPGEEYEADFEAEDSESQLQQ